jgi:putative DNA primase/helicase
MLGVHDLRKYKKTMNEETNAGVIPSTTNEPKKFTYTAQNGAIQHLTRAEIAALKTGEMQTEAEARKEEATALDRELATYASLDDVGNQMRMVRRFGTKLRFCAPNEWRIFGDQVWETLKDDGEVREMAIEVTRLMQAEIDTIEDDPNEVVVQDANGKPKPTLADVRRAAYDAWRKNSRSARKIADMVSMSRSHPDIRASRNDFDADPWLMAVGNGVLDLRSRELRPARPEDMLTQQMGVEYDATAQCPVWEAFLKQVQPNKDVREYLQRYSGYCLTGLTSEQIFLFFLGAGANGKGTYVDTLAALFGDHHARVRANVIASGTAHAAEARFGLAPIVGRRLITFGELEERASFNESLIKELTGQDPVEIETKGQQAFQYLPIAKYILTGNYKPRISGTDMGVWRRVRLVPWSVTISIEQRDRRLRDKLITELPGVLNWALDGLADYVRGGLGETPQAIQVATAEYRDDSDVLGQFLAERCVVDPYKPEMETLGTCLYVHYNSWCYTNGHKALASNSLATRLKDRGLKKGEGRKRYTWKGIAILTDNDRDKAEEVREAGVEAREVKEEAERYKDEDDDYWGNHGPGAEGMGVSPTPGGFREAFDMLSGSDAKALEYLVAPWD